MAPIPQSDYRQRRQGKWLRASLLVSLCAAFVIGMFAGCRIDNIDDARRVARVIAAGTRPEIQVKRTDGMKYRGPLSQLWTRRRAPSERTQLFLRQYDLYDRYQSEPEIVIQIVQRNCRRNPTMSQVHALAELAEIEGDWARELGESEKAARMYAVSVIHAYRFLFDPKLDLTRNAYDPQFRAICDVYNRALGGMLQILCLNEDFQPGTTVALGDLNLALEFQFEIAGRWKAEEFERFELVRDYSLEGIENSYHTFGLGVPLIAVRRREEQASPYEQYYPPGLSLPMTAFCELLPTDDEEMSYRATIRLYDPLEFATVDVHGRQVPLESEFTLPLAYYLRDPLLNSNVLSTATLINADLANEFYGMYMIEPYDPQKIPVVMVHGFWSSPVTWLQMLNDLRANEEIRANYQFWFYMYPTGQPFWVSARQLRRDLESLRMDVDPFRTSESMDQMVLVGHSMGGLVSRMQSIDSENHFWAKISEFPFEQMEGDAEDLSELRELFFFDPNPSVSRVITIATPHHGTHFANQVTRWLSQKVFTLPQMLQSRFSEFVEANRQRLNDQTILKTITSVDSLAPDSPAIEALQQARLADHTLFHNIYGDVSDRGGLRRLHPGFQDPGDGVVSVESAQMEGVESQIAVDAEHMLVHKHPRTIVEVRRILLEHLEYLGRIDNRDLNSLVLPTYSGNLPGPGE